MTRVTIHSRQPDSPQTLVVYHFGIDAKTAEGGLGLLFLNFPSRDDLLAQCDAASLKDARIMVERADWPEAWPTEQCFFRMDVPMPKGQPGRISGLREVIVPNAGRLAIEVLE